MLVLGPLTINHLQSPGNQSSSFKIQIFVNIRFYSVENAGVKTHIMMKIKFMFRNRRGMGAKMSTLFKQYAE